MTQQSPSSSTFLWPSQWPLKCTQRNHGNLHLPYSQTFCTCSIFGGQRKTIHRGSSVTTQPLYMQWPLKLYFLLYVTAPHNTHLSSLSLMTNPINSPGPSKFHDKTLQEIFFQGVDALLSFSCKASVSISSPYCVTEMLTHIRKPLYYSALTTSKMMKIMMKNYQAMLCYKHKKKN